MEDGLITLAVLEDLAGTTAFRRGEEYFSIGAVGRLRATDDICDRSLPITLAGKLESARPGDAVSLYRRVVPLIVEQTNNTAYDEAIKLIRKVGGLMKTQKQLSQFGDYLAELRVQFKPKRNFIKLLDGVARSTAGAKSVL